MTKTVTPAQAQMNIAIVALVALVAIVGLVTLVMNAKTFGLSPGDTLNGRPVYYEYVPQGDNQQGYGLIRYGKATNEGLVNREQSADDQGGNLEGQVIRYGYMSGGGAN